MSHVYTQLAIGVAVFCSGLFVLAVKAVEARGVREWIRNLIARR